MYYSTFQHSDLLAAHKWTDHAGVRTMKSRPGWIVMSFQYFASKIIKMLNKSKSTPKTPFHFNTLAVKTIWLKFQSKCWANSNNNLPHLVIVIFLMMRAIHALSKSIIFAVLELKTINACIFWTIDFLSTKVDRENKWKWRSRQNMRFITA